MEQTQNKAVTYDGLLIYKKDYHSNKLVEEYRFFCSKKEREAYIETYIYNRPTNAKRVQLLKRFDATFSNFT